MQPLPAGPTGSILTIPTFSAANLGRYQVRVSGAFGTVLSGVAELAANGADAPSLANLSGRAIPGSGENTTIAGFLTRVRSGT
jgi:hypothetical protein